jgi:hypothetical protein
VTVLVSSKLVFPKSNLLFGVLEAFAIFTGFSPLIGADAYAD